MFCNFEYEVYEGSKNFYLRGNLMSVTKEPKYEVFQADLFAWKKIMSIPEIINDEEKMNDLAEEIEGYSMPLNLFEEI